MSRPIDADALRERLQNLAYDDWNQGITTSFADACHEIIEIVEEQPTIAPSAQPERKMGKWIDKSGGIENAWNYCSVCGEQAIDLYDFCPNCGADMRGDSDD